MVSAALASYLHVFLHSMNGDFREIHRAILSALPIPHREAFLREIQVFQAQFLYFARPHPTLPEQVEGSPNQQRKSAVAG
jgi:hypothetical protein